MTVKFKSTIVGFLPKVLGRKFIYSLRYFHQRKKWPNLYAPKDLSEIIISNLLRNYYDRYVQYEDKVNVRDYIANKGLGNILLKHYFVWDKTSDILIDELPEKFVLKTNNGGGGKNIFLCRDKRYFDFQTAIQKLENALSTHDTFEKQYNLITPKIICEELVDTGSEAWPIDYKFTCIHGKVVDVFIGSGREAGVKFCTKDINWNSLPYTKEEFLPENDPPKPTTLKEMINVAQILSQDFPFVRVDLYEYNGRVYFSELTFTPWGGLMYSYKDEVIKEYGRLLREKPSDYVINNK